MREDGGRRGGKRGGLGLGLDYANARSGTQTTLRHTSMIMTIIDPKNYFYEYPTVEYIVRYDLELLNIRYPIILHIIYLL